MTRQLLTLLVLLCALAPAALAAETETRAKDLFRQIRCPVCEAQTIDGSDTDIAKDLRALVLKKLESGASDEDIFNDLRAAYGDSIIMTPPVNTQTAPLWIAPFALFAVGLCAAAFIILRKKKATP